MAYEYTDFTMSYDLADTKEHRVFDGSLLRVWKKVNGEWRIAAPFARPNTGPREQGRGADRDWEKKVTPWCRRRFDWLRPQTTPDGL
jgi:hypothetical protein